MQKGKQVKKNSKHHKSSPVDWFKYVNDDVPKLTIPVGPRFQAYVPEWSGPPQKKYPHCVLTESDSSKRLGTVVWSIKDPIPETDEDVVGKGRSDSCDCYAPGSALCIKRHISEKRFQLQNELGPAFQKWKFDQMGEAAAKSWKQSEQQKFILIVKHNPSSEGKSFIRPALESFPSKSYRTIVNYYFNVYLPRRMSVQTRSGCTIVDTDDEEEQKSPCAKGSRKRAQVDGAPLYTSKLVKARYLTGRR